MADDDEDDRLRTVALQNARSILLARQRAEEALRKQSEWLRITLASIGDAVITTSADGRVTFLNGVAEALTGWNQAEAAGRPLPDVFRVVNEDYAFHSHQMEPFVEELKRSLAKVKPRAVKVPVYSTVTGALASGALTRPRGSDCGTSPCPTWSRPARRMRWFSAAA